AGSSWDEELAAAPGAGGAGSRDRRGSRDGPGQSQIDRPDSVGACGTGALDEVAKAGVNPGSGGGAGAGSDIGGAGVAGAAADCVISGSSFIASPFSSPAEASVGLPS
ncbi:MAG TPA: hypothetical protein VFT22_15455, partial [Kofleriaceae bacterium]|nr:hypothetical protein [Kofleriaceae bacterium]